MLLGAPLLRLASRGPGRWLAACAWMISWCWLSPTPLGLLRSVVASSQAPRLRIVSLNCAGGDVRAVEEAMATNAHVILLQESPSSDEVRRLLNRHPGWQAAVGIDASVLARGSVRALPGIGRQPNFQAAGVRLPGYPQPLHVASLRLQPPTLRLDFWNRSAWRAYASDRSSRRSELRAIVERLQAIKPGEWILGGDFNTPPDPCVDQALNGLQLQDAFPAAGRGWGGTAPADFPLVRIDRILCPKGWSVRASWTIRSRFSDHRMVVADLRVVQAASGRDGPDGRSALP
ncbi:MAG: endonuclease/exonuclease/phosphatase family protein [Fimbriimonadales bacterium]